jgi:hypothetical protein
MGHHNVYLARLLTNLLQGEFDQRERRLGESMTPHHSIAADP